MGCLEGVWLLEVVVEGGWEGSWRGSKEVVLGVERRRKGRGNVRGHRVATLG